MIEIKELQLKEDIIGAFPIMNELRSHLDVQSYMELVQEAMEKDMYHMVALYENGEIVAVIGYKPMITLYYGRFIWVCDLVTKEDKRSKGFGEELLSFVENWAKDNKYQAIALSSGLQRTEAHRFYEEKMAYDKVSYVFKKLL
ncbi:GNAT family N-acetyltransferase [Virgibacillus halodenitrificans]|uniref:GNAT family N-acetyltransferase n=1 Tax=Virgibacillus halodenitrificans TaxID=1482 RepID=UPI001F1F4C3A|nr:GNAT family N-acetyltransferase [Virgibacillus halodenitrificans]